MSTDTSISTSPVAIFARLFDPERIELSPAVAETLLRITFDQQDRDRMHELSARNRDAGLTREEEAELDSYLHVGSLLDVMHARARVAQRKSVTAD